MKRIAIVVGTLMLVTPGLARAAGETRNDNDAAVASAKQAQERVELEKQHGREYSDEAAAEEGATRLPSGLVLRTLRAGTGASPTASDTVRVHYRGTFIDGEEFDSSYKRGAPSEFALKGVIPCWTEALQKMRVGERARIVCPSTIAYGDRGRSGISGGATLIFDIDLIAIMPKPPAPKLIIPAL